ALSWDHHMANTNLEVGAGLLVQQLGMEAVTSAMKNMVPPRETVRERFWAWVDDPRPYAQTECSLSSVLTLLSTFWNARNRPNIVLLHYDDLRSDLQGQMRSLAKRLSIEIPEAQWPALVRAAGFDEMRRDANDVAPMATHAIWKNNAEFFHRGTSGQWR